ncbi:ECF transporter S component [Pseudolysinimonas sp.]
MSAPDAPPVVPASTSVAARPARRFPTRVLLSAAAFGAAGAIYISLISWASVGTGAIAYFFYAATIALWALPVLAAQALLRRPGVGLLTSFLMGLISAPFIGGSAFHILSFVAVGILVELPFAIRAYRDWSRRMFWIGHPLAMAVYTALYAVFVFLAYDVPAAWVLAIIAVVGVASCFAVTALAQLIGGRLRKAGLGGTTAAS